MELNGLVFSGTTDTATRSIHSRSCNTLSLLQPYFVWEPVIALAVLSYRVPSQTTARTNTIPITGA